DEHADCLSLADGQEAILVVEVDNSFSYFTAKDVVLIVSKRAAAPSASASLKPSAAAPQSQQPGQEE
ncbi:unnamed protein product, partial [Polarella glacialis]